MFCIYETSHFILYSNDMPHVSRDDGGHLTIYPRQAVVHRWDLDVPRAQALMRLSMLSGEAMITALNEHGIPVERINFQDNGNWGIATPDGPKFHLHLYGRARGSRLQTHGEALRFPNRDEFYKLPPLEPLNEEDCSAIRSRMEKLATEPRYALRGWHLRQD